MEIRVIQPEHLRDLRPLLLDAQGELTVHPAAVYATTSPEERALFGVRQGLYSFPTTELVAFLRQRLRGRRAIEIGAGAGVLARALAIPATDSRLQEDPAIRAHYLALGQPVVPYAPWVEKLDAHAAVAKYRPQVVIACWVTHRYNPARPAAGGNMFGVDEEALLAQCEEYLFVGNEKVHAGKALWRCPHGVEYPDWLYSRAANGSREFVASWPGLLSRACD